MQDYVVFGDIDRIQIENIRASNSIHKNKIGYNMSAKTKYKVLATAAPEDKLKYIELLWKDGKEPNALKKYYLRKNEIDI